MKDWRFSYLFRCVSGPHSPWNPSKFAKNTPTSRKFWKKFCVGAHFFAQPHSFGGGSAGWKVVIFFRLSKSVPWIICTTSGCFRMSRNALNKDNVFMTPNYRRQWALKGLEQLRECWSWTLNLSILRKGPNPSKLTAPSKAIVCDLIKSGLHYLKIFSCTNALGTSWFIVQKHAVAICQWILWRSVSKFCRLLGDWRRWLVLKTTIVQHLSLLL